MRGRVRFLTWTVFTPPYHGAISTITPIIRSILTWAGLLRIWAGHPMTNICQSHILSKYESEFIFRSRTNIQLEFPVRISPPALSLSPHSCSWRQLARAGQGRGATCLGPVIKKKMVFREKWKLLRHEKGLCKAPRGLLVGHCFIGILAEIEACRAWDRHGAAFLWLPAKSTARTGVTCPCLDQWEASIAGT